MDNTATISLILLLALNIWRWQKRQEQQHKHTMSAITDWAAAEQADLTAIANTLNGIQTGIAALDALITQLQPAAGTLSPTDQAALDAVKGASAALVTQAAAISTAPPAAPAAAS